MPSTPTARAANAVRPCAQGGYGGFILEVCLPPISRHAPSIPALALLVLAAVAKQPQGHRAVRAAAGRCRGMA